MAVTSLVRAFAALAAAALGLFDLGGVEQRRDDRRRADADRDTRLHQLGSPFLVASIVAHSILSLAFRPRPYAVRAAKGSVA